MIRSSAYLLLLLLSFSRVQCSSTSTSSSSSTSSSTVPPFAPILNWRPSWIASSAQGTTIAVSCRLDDDDDDKVNNKNNCVLLLMRSSAPPTVTSNLQWKPSPPPITNWKEIQLVDDATLRILPIENRQVLNSRHDHQPASPPSWMKPIGRDAICVMTGFASDVDHVTRVIQKEIHLHRFIYDDDGSGNTFPMPLSGIVQWLSQTVRSAAGWKRGRPYGLQAMLIGKQPQPQEANNKLFVYSVDPSGSWRHWGSGSSAIGRNAEDVRQQLYDVLVQGQKDDNKKETNKKNSLNPLNALKVAFQALLPATKAASYNQENDQYEAILFWIDDDDSRCKVAIVDPDAVKACRDEIWETLEASTQRK